MWEIPTNMWEISINMWEISINMWEIPINMWEIPINMWEISNSCSIADAPAHPHAAGENEGVLHSLLLTTLSPFLIVLLLLGEGVAFSIYQSNVMCMSARGGGSW